MGHIQATGMDAARAQAVPLPRQWRERRDREKFESMIGFGRALPEAAQAVRRGPGSPRATRAAGAGLRGAAARPRLLPDRLRGLRRGERDLRRGHDAPPPREVTGDTVTFDYEAKGGKRRIQAIMDADLAKLVRTLDSREGGGRELLASSPRASGGRRSTTSTPTSRRPAAARSRPRTSAPGTATVLRRSPWPLSRAERDVATKAARTRAKNLAVKQVARFLGNTPAVCRPPT